MQNSHLRSGKIEPYPWTRYWCTPSGLLDLSDGGYLVGPTSEGSRVVNDVRPFAAYAGVFHVLVCLGEPGSGKSEEVKTACTIQNQMPAVSTVLLDLERCNSHDFLQSALLPKKEFERWKQGKVDLHVFFENFERMRVRPHLFAQDLIDALSGGPIRRLFIRLICRTFDWAPTLEPLLGNLFDDVEEAQRLQVCELAPLSRTDVELAARIEFGDASPFMAEVEKADVVPLAIRPITLRFLLDTFRADGRLPQTTSQLFRQGCTLLCLEQNPELYKDRRATQFSASERLAASSRLAALAILAQKSAINVSPASVYGLDDLHIEESVGGTETYDGVNAAVSRELLTDTLGQALFTSRGSDRFGFSHQSYAEFLAAIYLHEHGCTQRQLVSLFSTSESKVVPQLRIVAAWLATMNSKFLKYMQTYDPLTLLLGDLESVRSLDKEAVVSGILQLIEERKLPPRDFEPNYHKLNHPTLDTQLAGVIRDPAYNVFVRVEAVRIAKACGQGAIVPHLLDVAFDSAAPGDLRRAAIRSVSKLDKGSCVKLVSLAVGPVKNDANDEVKGAALEAVYPHYLSPQTLFNSALSDPKINNFFGTYYLFLQRHVFQPTG